MGNSWCRFKQFEKWLNLKLSFKWPQEQDEGCEHDGGKTVQPDDDSNRKVER